MFCQKWVEAAGIKGEFKKAVKNKNNNLISRA